MDINLILKTLQEILESKTQITLDTDLTSMSQWDSVAVLTVIAYLNHNFNLVVSLDEMSKIVKVSDLIELLKMKN